MTKINPIYAGKDSLLQLANWLSDADYSGYVLLVDENTSTHCLPLLMEQVPMLESALTLETESGEQHKNLQTCQHIWQLLLERNADRKTLFINLGGGVICDMGGFIASVYKRGIPFIHIPTTLLAQCDAAIGGKTGVDISNLKNILGTFTQPEATIIFPPFLRTLGKRQLLSGFAEILKHALIADENLWRKATSFSWADPQQLENILPASVEIKKRIVSADFSEKNERMLLNFGHTFGHALESLSFEWNELPLLHGEAIAAGMVCESYLSYKANKLSHSALDEICACIFSLYPRLPLTESHFERLLDLMRNDKKNSDGYIRFSLLNTIGEATAGARADEDMIRLALHFYMEKSGLQKSL